MPRMLARLLNPLRHIKADPDQLVLEADALLRRVEDNEGLDAANTARSTQAQAKIALATYLREYRPD
ncbi:hypothetical protein ACFV9E_06670 [Streptomyces sp. NPDC059835]|uniref:hypothetical protein n=1 Tax=Streptomyces sp. NPDC059835 TaxID=3346967 RepID=UPI00364B2660